jgi:hypothetical protein
MNCSDIAEQIPTIARGLLPADEREACLAHISSCEACADALRGAEAMQFLRRRDSGTAREELFQRIHDEVSDKREARVAGRRFWLGTAVGGAVAASLLAVIMMLGVLVRPVDLAPQLAEFRVSAEEPRVMHVAIETERPLRGAEISVLLSGAVEIDGAGGRREFNWTEDLDAGINKLSLPVLARGAGGGKMLVRLTHPDSEQIFVIDLPTDS